MNNEKNDLVIAFQGMAGAWKQKNKIKKYSK